MTKEDIIEKVAQCTGYSRQCTTTTVNALLTEITNALVNGDKVQFFGFGTFKPKEKAARIGRDPRKNEVVNIPSRIMPVFTAGKSLKDAVVKEIE